VVKPQQPDIQKAMFKNGRLRLLMTLLGFDRLGLDDDPNASWIIPSAIPSARLHLDCDSLKHTINEPQFSYDDDKVPEDFIRRKPSESAEETSQRRSTGTFDDDDSDGLDDFIELDLFPAGGPTARKSDALDELKKRRRKRNRVTDELDDEAKAKKAEMRRLADLEKRRKIKSDLYVHASDDETDEEKDMEFFAQEEERRKNTSLRISRAISALSKATSGNGNKRKSGDDHHERSKKRRKNTHGSGEESNVGSDEEDVIQISSDSSSSDSDEDMEDPSITEQEEDQTPLSSEQVTPQDDLEIESTTFLKPIAADMVTPLEQRETKGLESEDEFPVTRSIRPRLRAGFVIESDSE
jgi:replication fork protection complex subunit Tof1/Swi1